MRKFLLLFFAVSTFQFARAQDFSNKGKDFYLCFPQHVPSGNTLAKLSIWITSDQASSGTVTMANGAFSGSFNIAANGLAEIQVPFAAAHISNTESSNGTTIQILKKSIRVLVDAGKPAVVAYVQQFGAARSAASLLLPVNVLGKKYYAISFTQTNGSNNGSYLARSQFQIIATQDNTVVTITPRKNGVLGTPFNVTFPLAGDMIQYQSSDAAAATQDLTGTYIESIASGTGGCLPIAVFSGSSNLTMGSQTPLCNGGSYDPLLQQLYPTSTWGKNFGFVPFAHYPRGVPYRVMASVDNTNVFFDGTLVATLNAGQIYPAAFTSNPPVLTAATYITADQPVCIAEYMQASGCAGNPAVGGGAQPQGDPDMVILNPIEQNIKDITIFSTKQEVIRTQWINILIPTAGISSFLISRNGFPLAPPTGGTWQPIASLPGYSYLQDSLPVPGTGADAGSSSISDSYRLVSDSGFNAIAYGLGDNESYAYSAGTNVKDIYQQISVSTQYGIETSPSVCTGSPFKFKISLPYKPLQLNWDLSNLPSPPPNASQIPSPTCTTYPLPADNTTYVCPDSIRMVGTVPIYWFSLPSYYMVNTVGIYPIHLTALTSNSDGCGNTQNIDFNLQVSDPPIADFSYTTPGCVADTVHFTDISETVKPEYHWYWDFGDPASGANDYSSIKNPLHLFATAGPHTVRFSSITTPGCLSDTITHIINVPAQPTATITGSTAVCQNATSPPVTIIGANGTAPYTISYHINSGPILTASTTGTSGTASTTIILPAPTGTVGSFIYTIDSIRNTNGSQLCDSHITGQSATITVNPLPTANISGNATVCQNSTPLPQVSFTGGNAAQPYTFYYTVTGPGAPAGTQQVTTPTASNTVNVTQVTGIAGTFTYTLTGVQDGSATACTVSFSPGQAVVVKVNPLPTATVSGNNELCLNSPAPNITFTGAGGTAPYTFTYTINGGANQTVTTTAGNSVNVAVPTSAAGTFVYSLVSVKESSTTACANIQSGSATVIVDPQPTASFTYSAPQCQSNDITYTPAFGVSSGTVVSWVWNYGDGTGSHVRSDGNPFTVNYATPGPKTVTFQTTSDKGCLSAVFTQIVTINPKPHAGFISPQICLLDPYAQFTDTSSVAPPSTITAWAWNFGDAYATPANPNTSGAQNPTHIYTHVGPYNVQLIITTNAGCKDTVIQGIYISDGNPQAAFNVINPANLCSNDSVGIINKSTIASGNITKIQLYWDYTNQPAVYDTYIDPLYNDVFKHKYPTLTTAATYKIHMQSYSGIACFSSRDTTITVNAAPVAQLNSIPDVCLNNGTVQFTQGSETAGVPGAGVYSGNGVSPSGLFDPLSAGVGVHTITYTFTSNFGCVDLKTTNVKVLDPPMANFSPAPITCQNNAILFTQSSTATAGTIVTWIWHWGDGTPDETYANGNPRSHTYTSAGSFTATLSVLTDYGCKSLPKSVTFTVNPQPHPQFTYTAVACLPQAKVDFHNTTIPGSLSDWTYQWNFDDVNAGGSNPNTSTATNPSHIYTSLGPFNVHLQASSPLTSCTNDTFIQINPVKRAPVASFSINKPSVCLGQAITVINHSTSADGTITNWLWNYGDNSGTTTGQVQQPHTYQSDGTYDITLTVTTSFGCTDDTVKSIRVYPNPTANAGPDQVVLAGGISHLQGSATGNMLTYLWRPHIYLSDSTILNPQVRPLENTTYELIVTAEGGCTATDSVYIEVLKAPLIPNTFTPNNDGIHDLWEIKYLFQYPDNHVQVFTRTGQLVFESHGYQKPWDGTKNGKPLPFDTYYYIIEPGSGRAAITGYVTIVK